VSGGSANAQYAVGAGYRRETTVYPGDFAYQKASARMRLSFTTPDKDKRGKATLSASYVSDRNNLPSTDLTSFSTTPPNTPRAYDQYGALNWENSTFDNPFASLLKKYKANSNNLIASAVLSYEVLRGLQVKASLGYTRMQMDEIQTNPIIALNPAYGSQSGYSFFANSSISSWIIEPQANYELDLGGGTLNVLAGMTFQQDLRSQKGFYGTGYTSDALLEDMTAAASLIPLGVVNTQYRYNAVFGRVNYNWQGKYIANFTGRRDGSSRFGPDNRFANFGAVGVAWIFSKENWIANSLPFLSFGKLRGSYGTTGNDQIADYGYLDTYSPAPPYQDIRGMVRGLYATRLFNATYGWEKNVKLEAGLELGFSKDRILFSASWYRNRSSNQLVNYALPGVTGFVSIRSNLPALVANTGMEFELMTTNIKQQHFTWSSSLNLSIPRNKLLDFPGLESSAYNKDYTVGQPLNIFKGAHLEQVDPEKGIYQLKDLDGDKKVTFPNDYMYTKKLGVTLFGGLQNSLQYKSWQLEVLFQFVKQNSYNYLYASGATAPGGGVNQPVAVLDRWLQPGDHTGIQKFTQAFGAAGTAFINVLSSDQVITDASFIRLKNLSLSWQLPEKWMQQLHLKSSQVYVQGQNLFTITHYRGLDPETAAKKEIYPPLRSCTAGLRLSF
jgi:TonB-linked SusC/RagA family outer membrane protein